MFASRLTNTTFALEAAATRSTTISFAPTTGTVVAVAEVTATRVAIAARRTFTLVALLPWSKASNQVFLQGLDGAFAASIAA